jgi:hypothetical protein
MKVGDAHALDVGFWWARSNYEKKLTVVEVKTHECPTKTMRTTAFSTVS